MYLRQHRSRSVITVHVKSRNSYGYSCPFNQRFETAQTSTQLYDGAQYTIWQLGVYALATKLDKECLIRRVLALVHRALEYLTRPLFASAFACRFFSSADRGGLSSGREIQG